MSVRGLIGAFSIIVAFLPGQATGQDRAGGYYSELRGGVAFLDDVEADAGSGPNADFSFETGWVAEGAVGYQNKNGLRGEFTFSYRKNEADKVEISGNTFKAEFDLEAYSGMANLLYELDYNRVSGNDWTSSVLRPYIGVGFGVLQLDDGTDTDTAFAYQAIGGLAYHFTPSWAVTASYVYFVTKNADFNGVELDYMSHNFMTGIRYSF